MKIEEKNAVKERREHEHMVHASIHPKQARHSAKSQLFETKQYKQKRNTKSMQKSTKTNKNNSGVKRTNSNFQDVRLALRMRRVFVAWPLARSLSWRSAFERLQTILRMQWRTSGQRSYLT